jgi:uncharacterized protein
MVPRRPLKENAMRWYLMLGALLLGLLTGSGASAQTRSPRTVRDDLGMFSAAAKSRANAEIARIQQAYRIELAIETTHPPKQPADLDLKDQAAVAKFFEVWAKERFESERVNGVLVLILDKPTRLEVVYGGESKGSLFNWQDRLEVAKRTREKLNAKDADGALLAITSAVADALQKNSKANGSTSTAAKSPPPTAKSPAPTANPEVAPPPAQGQAGNPIVKLILWAAAIFLGIWLLMAIFRGVGNMGGAGGGGFLTGFLGGLFGAAAGMWLYSHFFGDSTPAAWGGETAYPSEPTDSGSEPQVTGMDYGPDDTTATDGDLGNAGGDWGGGDWGGGGGDWGGGGGEW